MIGPHKQFFIGLFQSLYFLNYAFGDVFYLFKARGILIGANVFLVEADDVSHGNDILKCSKFTIIRLLDFNNFLHFLNNLFLLNKGTK